MYPESITGKERATRVEETMTGKRANQKESITGAERATHDESTRGGERANIGDSYRVQE